tara:strand:+ start:6900 stop:7409 length:510 start_codon:yes stop_codon:yes gene_type:complete
MAVVVYKAKKNDKQLVKQARVQDYNFLKYWRVVRYWAKRKYEISEPDLEILLYLYDIDLFTRGQFRKFEGLLSWDKTRFNQLRDKGYIVQWREDKTRRQAKLYTLSVSAKRMISTLYKKLLQEEHIPENRHNNPIFSGSDYTDKVYRQAIRRMNKEREARIKAEREANL